MKRFILIYGSIAGLIVAVPMLLMVLSLEPGEMPAGVAYGYLTMLVALSAVFVGIKQYRDKVLGGVIRFGPALLVGLGISFIAGLFYVAAWEISVAVTGYDFAGPYSQAMVDAARARGASPAEVQQAMADAESFVRMYRNPLYRMPMTFIEIFPVGVLISLLSAALLRNSAVLPARTRQ